MAFKTIYERTDQELEANIQEALKEARHAELDFWKLCAGVDAYMEKRRRKMGLPNPGNQSKEDK